MQPDPAGPSPRPAGHPTPSHLCCYSGCCRGRRPLGRGLGIHTHGGLAGPGAEPEQQGKTGVDGEGTRVSAQGNRGLVCVRAKGTTSG